MKLKTPVIRSIVIISIILLSVLIGFIYQAVWHRIDLKNYPRDHYDLVRKYSEEYAVPEYVIYGVMKYESDFASNNVSSDGGIGLMGLTNDEFDYMLKQTKENLNHDSLYGPQTNIKYGTLMLSGLYAKFGRWDLVYCAKTVDMPVWESWLENTANYDEDGMFVNVPDENAQKNSEKIVEYVKKYREMYYD